MRQIILDTETTGLEPKDGHRIIEIGCIELQDRMFTGNNFHVYINPERHVEQEALAIHGITNEFLQDKPVFGKIVQDFLNYIQNCEIIAHNANFDIGFLNHEINLAYQANIIENPYIIQKHLNVIDSLQIARQLHPGQRNNLDALCKRYKIDNTKREFHGALLDAHLLTEVYLAMTGGQKTLNLFASENEQTNNTHINAINTTQTINALDQKNIQKSNVSSDKTSNSSLKTFKNLKIIPANDQEISLHEEYLTLLKKKAEKHYFA